ncbi:beta-glucosidase family protein [Novosphingobium sp. KACC 22771]|uniref:beta-glucosidase family protein n=1 Tax=Novosphingobium sp. KACC 22771 TaxID=3025670 RepID=UPI002365D673|nr:glycoside hydrolase family 3 C-terminal domain-containing protein [Novosphingobium sp. KACC 22771]WDF74340.1 glycoside hydrolase family 3 C-terminal domain-containing protein [Novosphingobium sp. KACC 22771]
MPPSLSRSIAALLLSAAFTGSAALADQPDAQARADATLKEMTAEEKAELLHGKMLLMLAPAKRPEGVFTGAGYIEGVPRLGVPPLVESDASLGVSNLMNQRPGDVATSLPSGLSLAATWNPAALYAGGRMIGSEARAKGVNVMLVGGVNLVRDARGGRNFEYLGEDPLLAGTLVGQQIAGVQSNRMIATIKHFALNNQETGRSSATVNMDEVAMRESDLLAFELGIEKGKPGSVMCAYNRVNTVFACENKFLLSDVLRRDWGYKGFVMSDWGAVHSTEALLAGLDQQSGDQLDKKRYFSTELAREVAAGKIPASAIDTAARRILYAIYANGLEGFDPKARGTIDYDANAKVAEQAAEEGVVLLRNEGGILPLAASARKIVLIGGHGDTGALIGGGSSQVVPVGGIKLKLKGSENAANGFVQRLYGGASPLEGLRAALPGAEVSYLDGSNVAAAAQAAAKADIAIVLAEKFSSEVEDNTDLTLDEGQDALIEAVAAANAKTVVVLETGNPVLMPWREKVPAIVSAWYLGQRGAFALGRILSGAVNPSGRLPVTFPASADQLPNPVLPGSTLPPPSAADKAVYGINTNSPAFDITYPEGADVGYRWYDRKGLVPLYAFGHGLSYTSFAYDGLTIKGGKSITISFRVTNTGKYAGADVPQVYLTLPGQARRLIGWSKPHLKPGETRQVSLTADPRLLANFDSKAQRWVVKPDVAKVEVARAANAPVLTGRIRLTAAKLRP